MMTKVLADGDSIELGLARALNSGIGLQAACANITGAVLAVEGTLNGTDYFAVSMESYADPSVHTTAPVVGGYWCNAVGLRSIRVTCTGDAAAALSVSLEGKEG